MGYSFSRKNFGKIGQYLTQPNPRRTVTYKVVQHVYYIAKHCWSVECGHSTLCKSHTLCMTLVT